MLKRRKKATNLSPVQIKAPLSVVLSMVDEEEDFLYLEVASKPLIVHTLLSYEHMLAVDEVIIVLKEESLKTMAELCRRFELSKVCKLICSKVPGNPSLERGVYECDPKIQYVAIGDPRRPFVSDSLMRKLLGAAQKTGAAAPFFMVRDTIKVVERETVVSTPPRENLYVMQSPYVVEINMCKAALLQGAGSELSFTALIEEMGLSFSVVEGLEENIVVAQRHDLMVAQMLFEQWDEKG